MQNEETGGNASEDSSLSHVPGGRTYELICSEDQLDVVLDISQNQSQSNDGETHSQHRSLNPMRTRSKSGINKTKVSYVRNVSTCSDHSSLISEPATVEKLLHIPHWKEAMFKEFEAITKNDTWMLVPYSEDQRVVDSKWVFKTKYKANGEIERFKARLVARGF